MRVKSFPVVIHLKPRLRLLNDTTVCEGETVYVGSTGGLSYIWNGLNGFSATTSTFTIPSAQATHNRAYHVTTFNNVCQDTGTFRLTVKAIPTVTTSSNSPVCIGQDIELNASGGDSYRWTGPNGFASTQQNPVINNARYAIAGNYHLRITNNNGCSKDEMLNVVVKAAPKVNIASSSPVCEQGSIELYASGGGTSFNWTGPNGFTSNAQNPVINNVDMNAIGIYQVTAVNGNGCETTASVSVNILPQPTISLLTNAPICQGQTLRATGNGTYIWTGPNGFSSNTAGSDIRNVSTNYSGTYTVTVTGKNGCINKDSVLVNVHPPLNVNISSNSPVCEGTTLNLNASGGTSYIWTGPNGFTSTAQNPVIDAATMGHYGKYTVSVSNASGCTGSASTNVVINLKPHVSAAANSPVCEGQVLYLQGRGGMSYQWTDPKGFNSTQTSPIRSNAQSSMSGKYRVIGSNSYGCEDTAYVNLNINSGPSIAASYNSPVNIGGVLTLSASGNASSYRWAGPNRFLSVGQSTSLYNVQLRSAGVYTVTAKGANGCSSVASVNVVLGSKQMLRPEATNNKLPEILLYPNPASNVVTVESKTAEPMTTVQVYNALGQLVYSGNAEGATKYQLTVNGYASGLYNIKVILEDGTQLYSKFPIAK